jgi:hypothetical protein
MHRETVREQILAARRHALRRTSTNEPCAVTV